MTIRFKARGFVAPVDHPVSLLTLVGEEGVSLAVVGERIFLTVRHEDGAALAVQLGGQSIDRFDTLWVNARQELRPPLVPSHG